MALNGYYFQVDGRGYGPFTAEQARGLISRGEATPETLTSVDRRVWRKARTFPELCPELAGQSGSWHIASGSNGKEFSEVGYTTDQLVAAVRSGRLSAETLVRRDASESARAIRRDLTLSTSLFGGYPGTSESAAPTVDGREWYVCADGNLCEGPFNKQELAVRIRHNQLTRESLAWRRGETPVAIMKISELSDVGRVATPFKSASFGAVAGIEEATSGAGARQPSFEYMQMIMEQNKRLSRGYAQSRLWLTFLSIFTLLFGLGVFFSPLYSFAAAILVVSPLAWLSTGRFLRAVWEILPNRRKRLKSDAAAWRLWIPFYDFYWIRVMTVGALREMNEELASDRGTPTEERVGDVRVAIMWACAILSKVATGAAFLGFALAGAIDYGASSATMAHFLTVGSMTLLLFEPFGVLLPFYAYFLISGLRVMKDASKRYNALRIAGCVMDPERFLGKW